VIGVVSLTLASRHLNSAAWSGNIMSAAVSKGPFANQGLHAVVLSVLLVAFTLASWHKAHNAPQRVRMPSGPVVTFITPSKGRPTLDQALASMLNQRNPAWRAIVLYDGVPFNASSPPSRDPRVRYMSLPKSATANHAGQVRNFGMGLTNTEWVAFLDDDDFITNTYVDRLLEEAQREPSVECVIFRMYHSGIPPHVLPHPQSTNFVINQVGISFAVRKRLYDAGFFFIPGGAEDFVLLDRIRGAGKKMVLSEYMTYFVRAPPHLPDHGNFTRAVIN
jgi:hypothetical protein